MKRVPSTRTKSKPELKNVALCVLHDEHKTHNSVRLTDVHVEYFKNTKSYTVMYHLKKLMSINMHEASQEKKRINSAENCFLVDKTVETSCIYKLKSI